MDKSYLIFKRLPAGRKVITLVKAVDLQEAHEALLWLQKHHAGEMDLQLDEGEFFEILEEGHISEEEWREAVAQLKIKK
jgi:hypothetical protein